MRTEETPRAELKSLRFPAMTTLFERRTHVSRTQMQGRLPEPRTQHVPVAVVHLLQLALLLLLPFSP